MQMRVELVLGWGGEDVEQLRLALSRQQPGAVVTVVETREDGSPRVIRWDHPAPQPMVAIALRCGMPSAAPWSAPGEDWRRTVISKVPHSRWREAPGPDRRDNVAWGVATPG